MQFDRHNNRLTTLLAKYVQDTLDEKEWEELNKWFNENPANETLALKLKKSVASPATYDLFASLDKEQAWEKITSRTSTAKTQPLGKVNKKLAPEFWRYSAAVALLMLFSGSLLYTYIHDGSSRNNDVSTQAELRFNTASKAILQLGNHTTLALDDQQDGIIFESPELKISKKGYVISYLTDKQATVSEWHTLSTPVGSQYEIVLPDRSRIALNAVTSISFPSLFSQNRLVHLDGEAYFDVEEIRDYTNDNKKLPFQVSAGNTTVKVLGTQFNLAAYSTDTESKTTLLKGKVEVSADQHSVVLRPGEQAVAADSIQVALVDTEEAVSWKAGYFQFDNLPLKSVLMQLQRWYGFEIAPGTTIPNKHFSASISMDKPLTSVLAMLGASSDFRFLLVGNHLQIIE